MAFSGVEHVGIHSVAASLRECGHIVQVVDGTALGLSLQDVEKRLAAYGPNILGISPTLATISATLELAAKMHSHPNPPRIILGGHHATLCAETLLLNHDDIDLVIMGEAEYSLPGLLDSLHSDITSASLSGAAARMGGKIILNSPTNLPNDLDRLPFMARDTLEELVKSERVVAANINVSRGCPYSCSFCSTPVFYSQGPKYRRRSPANVCDEVEQLAERYDVHLYNLTDDIFLLPKSSHIRWMQEFADQLEQRSLRGAWSGMMRSEIFNSGGTIVKDIKRAGFHQILIGLESATDAMLEVYSKKSTLENYTHAVEALRENEIFLACAFISLNPYSTCRDLEENFTFLDKVVGDGMFYHYTSSLTVFPRTPIEARLRRDNLLIESDLPHRDGFSYHYADSTISRLAEALSIASCDNWPTDMLLLNIQFYMAFCLAKGQITESRFSMLFRQKDGLLQNMARSHRKFMNGLLRMARKNASLGEMADALTGYRIDGCPTEISALSDMYEDLDKLVEKNTSLKAGSCREVSKVS